MPSVPTYVTIRGISGYDPLYVPVAEESDIRAGFVEPTSPKISNDPAIDVQVNLSTFPLLVDLSRGAFQKFQDPNSHRYYEPVFTAGTTTPLAWTACPEAAIMPGCAWIEQNGAYAFKQVILFAGNYYGLDIKNNKVWKNTGGLSDAWSDVTPGSATGNFTELALNPQNTRLFLGTTSGNAFYYDGSTWTDWGKKATHFAIVGKDWWYITADGAGTYRTLKQDTGTNPVAVNVGLPNSAANAILHYQNLILIAKPEGVFEFNGRSKAPAEQIFYSLDQNSLNCLFLVLHGGSVYFNSGDGFFEYDGRAVLSKTFAQFDGKPTRAFYGGRTLNAYSDGRNLWLVFRVTTEDGYFNNFLVMWSGRTGGFHPFFVNSASNNGWNASAIWFDSNRVRYSVGYNSATGAKTGILLTDSSVPMAVDSTYPYTWSVGITSGWADFERDWASKWHKGVRISTYDLGDGTQATFTISYQKWADSGFTSLGSVVGTQDNAAINHGGSPVPGFTTSKVNTKLMLTNGGSASQKSKAAWVQSVHWIGSVVYTPAYYATVVATLDMAQVTESQIDETQFDGATVLAGLKAGIAQIMPVQIQMPDGVMYVGTLEPAGNGDLIDSLDSDTGLPRDRRFAFAFREYA